MSFQNDTKLHEMTCIKSDGLHRHYHFSNPQNSCYWFDIVTVPGYLFMTGDMGTWAFSRIRDMIQFFNHDSIDYGYWAEKLQMGSNRSEASAAYKEVDLSSTLEFYRRSLEEWLADTIEGEDDKGTLSAIKRSYREFAERIGRLKSLISDYSSGRISEHVFYRAVAEADMEDDSWSGHPSPWDWENLSPHFKPTYHYAWACEAIQYACQRIANKELAEAAVDKLILFKQVSA
ncbi:hypothetical protein ACOJ84_000011 [Morganella morganii]|uniref:hypothetical protein n=3 Tax=Morganella morganii TaxID=582 RepID=UPI000688E388|nr:hypothetical protein [Morganella morganii]ELI9035719.1 hypothetical protein [Morganella morganii]ELN8404617.1 hypothetical protein [Morganella morganii]NGE94988.1 hypothetical protein [Morganella morganii]OPL25603.1 hypothetical protein B5S45_08100 [Morganella morganii]RTY18269.1 hypothetical protein EKS23_16455 [Morganella morganii subsp. morganii]